MSGVCAREIVHEAFGAVLTGQESARLRPREFAAAWRARLTDALGAQTDIDQEPVWRQFDAENAHRACVIAGARAGPGVVKPLGGTEIPVLTFAIQSGGTELGTVSYGVCETCRMGLLYRIEFPREWRYCGLGTLALDTLQSRHPALTWHTSGQFAWARGFYDRYRSGSDSPWTENQRPCQHFMWWLAKPLRSQEPVNAVR